jgi:hypothetical protein
MDLFFIILFVVTYLLLGVYLIRTKQHGGHYIKILSGIALLILAWGLGPTNAFFGPKLILTALALTTFWKEYLYFRKVAK